MFDLILVSHGSLSKAMMETVQLIAGQQEGLKAYGLNLGDDVEAFGADVTAGIEESLKHGDVLVLTDLQSGSPYNVTVGAMGTHKIRHFTGMNLPMVLEALCDRQSMNIEGTCTELAAKSRKAILDVNQYLETLEGDSDDE